MKLRDVIHYYLGCRVRVTWHDGTIYCYWVETISDHGFILGSNIDDKAELYRNLEFELDWLDEYPCKVKFQPYLTHPTDLTPAQLKEYKALCHKNYFKEQNVEWESDTPESLAWLFKNKIDAFNLIESGQAFDMNNPNTSPHYIVNPKWYPGKPTHIKSKPVQEPTPVVRPFKHKMCIYPKPKKKVGRPRKERDVVKVQKVLKVPKCPVCKDTGEVTDRITGNKRPCVLCKAKLTNKSPVQSEHQTTTAESNH